MKKLTWKVPEGAKHFIVPFPCQEDTPLEELIFWQYDSEKYQMHQIEVTDPKTKDATIFNIVGFISKYPVTKVDSLLARLVSKKAFTPTGQLLTGAYLVEQLQLKNKDFKNTTHIVFLEISAIV